MTVGNTAVRWHVNKEGLAGRCEAKKKCRFNVSAEDHADTPLEAYEKWAVKEGLLEAPNHSKKDTIVLSDLDGTLIRSSLVLENAAELHDSGEIDLGETPNLWRADRKNEDLIVELATKYQQAIVGRGEEFVNGLATVNRLLANNENFYTTLTELIEHRRQGTRVVLITGSPDFLVKHLAGAFGFEYRSSQYGKDENGLFNGTIDLLMASGAEKTKAIRDLRLQEYQTVIGMGDTASDGPILAASHHSTLVEPTQHTLDMLRAQSIRIDKIIYK